MSIMASLGGSFGSIGFRPGQVIEVDSIASMSDYYSQAQLQAMSARQYAELFSRYVQMSGRCVQCGEYSCSRHTTLTGVAEKKEPKAQEKKDMMDSIKKWYEKHSDILITTAVVFLADHFMFGGKFRHKIEGMFDSLLNKAAKKVEAHEG